MAESKFNVKSRILTNKSYVFELDTISVQTAGAYTHTTVGLATTSTMKPLNIECSNPDMFNDRIIITVNDGSIAMSCNNADVGTSTMFVTVIETGDSESGGLAVRSQEFDILASRIANKMDKVPGTAPGKFLQTDSNSIPFWGDAASPTVIANATKDWLDDNVAAGETLIVDASLTVPGAAADAAATGALVKVSETEPTETTNRLWIADNAEQEITVPTYEEFLEIKTSLNAIGLDIENGQLVISPAMA